MSKRKEFRVFFFCACDLGKETGGMDILGTER